MNKCKNMQNWKITELLDRMFGKKVGIFGWIIISPNDEEPELGYTQKQSIHLCVHP